MYGRASTITSPAIVEVPELIYFKDSKDNNLEIQ